MRRVSLVLLVLGALMLSPSSSSAHKSSGIKVGLQVSSKTQNLDRSEAHVRAVVKNRRSEDVSGRRCVLLIRAQWFHPVTGEIRIFTEDWFMNFGRIRAGRNLRFVDTIYVEHAELTADPQWQPQGVRVKNPHCHVRALG
jgi:hypothetical protein